MVLVFAIAEIEAACVDVEESWRVSEFLRVVRNARLLVLVVGILVVLEVNVVDEVKAVVDIFLVNVYINEAVVVFL